MLFVLYQACYLIPAMCRAKYVNIVYAHARAVHGGPVTPGVGSGAKHVHANNGKKELKCGGQTHTNRSCIADSEPLD